MEHAELASRLTAFCRAHTGDPAATVSNIEVMPGHAGLSWGFVLHTQGRMEQLVIRMPPAGVRWVGTADVLRQARVMRALADTAVPVPPIRWAGDDLQWFERPYFVAERLTGDTYRINEMHPGDPTNPDAATMRSLAREAAMALAALHRVDWQAKLPDWGPPPALQEEVRRWDWLLERNADPARTSDPALTAAGPRVRELLLERLPAPGRTGVYHGDFQWSNLFCRDGRLVAVLDWELAGVGETRMDLGWFCCFNDPESWTGKMQPVIALPTPEEIIAFYEEAAGEPAHLMGWFRALAGYKFALITGLNLSLHRRGKRPDPHWEDIAPSAPCLLARAEELVLRAG
jgi:aminoglycoside phosphotransferase (APT) family kinase protein